MTRIVPLLGRVAVTLVVVAGALAAGWWLWGYYMDEPWTRDGRVRADIVAVAPDVSGLVDEVAVRDNQAVRKGDILMRIDRARFALALRQSDASVTGRKAALDLAQRDVERYRTLGNDIASQQRVEQAEATAAQADAAYRQALAERDLAELNLARSDVRAPVNGTIANLELRPGDYVVAGKGVMALIDTDSFRVEGYFEETKLPRIRVGQKARVTLMGGGGALTGRVESIAGGIEDRDRASGSTLLASVNPTFSWVRLAQRVPVRIALDPVPEGVALVAGRTATVELAGDAPAAAR